MAEAENTELNLIILAAGMGSRYGGLKQLDPVGPNGETILDYSLHDAVTAGFTRIIFVIRESFADAFRERLAERWPGLDAVCVFQKIDDLPRHTKPHPDRTKPWGTGHAVLTAKEAVTGPFAVINADDFYGRNAFQLLADFLANPPAGERQHPVCMIGYRLDQTLSAGGSVSRGICEVRNGELHEIVEHTRIARENGGAIRSADDSELADDSVVSMNCWGMPAGFMNEIEHQFRNFIMLYQDDLTKEFYLPAAVDRTLQQKKSTVSVLPTSARWFGITYPEDRDAVVSGIGQLVSDGTYPAALGACTS